MEKLTNGLNRRFIRDNVVAKAMFDKLRQYEDIEEFFNVDLLAALKLMKNDKIWYVDNDTNLVKSADSWELSLNLEDKAFDLLKQYEDDDGNMPDDVFTVENLFFKDIGTKIAATPYELDLNDGQKTTFIYRNKCTHCKNRNSCIESFSLQSEWRKQMLKCWEEFKDKEN